MGSRSPHSTQPATSIVLRMATLTNRQCSLLFRLRFIPEYQHEMRLNVGLHFPHGQVTDKNSIAMATIVMANQRYHPHPALQLCPEPDPQPNKVRSSEGPSRMVQQRFLISINQWLRMRLFMQRKGLSYHIQMPELEAKTQHQVQQFLDQHKVAVVDCYATWCGPCVKIAPFVHTKANQTGIGLIKVNVDEAADLASLYKIQAMPTFLVIQGQAGNVIWRQTGGSEGVVNQAFELAKSKK